MKLHYLALAAVVAFPAAAIGQTAADLEAFSQLDVNSDNMISQDEAAANQQLAANFGAADENADGSLSMEEYNSVSIQTEAEPATPDAGVAPSDAPAGGAPGTSY
jgi:hypothetical protein